MRRPLLVLFVLLALAPSSAMASQWFRCKVMGTVQQRCCCPASQHAEDAPVDAQPRAARACCCQVELEAGHAADPNATAIGAAHAAPVALASMVVIAAAPRVTAAPQRAWEAARPRGPPTLYLEHCALLI